jgi:DNA invertase Pin-like site-specific DNA recombinase
VGFLSLQEQIDTTSAAGRFYLHMLAALAEFERELIRDRTRAGMAAARKRGVILGRPRKMTAELISLAKQRIDNNESKTEVATDFGVNTATLRRLLKNETGRHQPPPS